MREIKILIETLFFVVVLFNFAFIRAQINISLQRINLWLLIRFFFFCCWTDCEVSELNVFRKVILFTFLFGYRILLFSSQLHRIVFTHFFRANSIKQICSLQLSFLNHYHAYVSMFSMEYQCNGMCDKLFNNFCSHTRYIYNFKYKYFSNNKMNRTQQ